MKPAIINILLLLLIPLFGFGQAALNRPKNVGSQNFLRYDMSNFSIPTAGKNQIWDFRDVLLDDRPSKIRLIAYTSEDTIFVAHTDGQTVFYNYLHGNQYVQTRYEKNHLRISHSTPQILLQYPLHFQQNLNQRFDGQLHHQLNLTDSVRNQSNVSLIGYGSLILPCGEIVNDVFLVRSRTRHAQTEEKLLERSQNSTYAFYTSESVVPIIEIVQQMRRTSRESTTESLIRHAYYYEPERVQMPFNAPGSKHFLQVYHATDENENVASLASIAPNPTRDQTIVTLNLNEATTVFLEIHTLQGRPVHSDKWEFPMRGVYHQSLYLNHYNLTQGTYLVTIRLNGQTETHKIQKK